MVTYDLTLCEGLSRFLFYRRNYRKLPWSTDGHTSCWLKLQGPVQIDRYFEEAEVRIPTTTL